MIVTEGGRWGGFGLYLLKGKPVFNYNFLILAEFRWEGQVSFAVKIAEQRTRRSILQLIRGAESPFCS